MYVLKRSHLNEMLLKKATVAGLVASGEIEVRGDGGKLDELFSLLDDFKSWFNIVLP
jgi:alkyl sulfatase BDS1-like metallo-beta-lactamase superfamily hydrolase